MSRDSRELLIGTKVRLLWTSSVHEGGDIGVICPVPHNCWSVEGSVRDISGNYWAEYNNRVLCIGKEGEGFAVIEE